MTGSAAAQSVLPEALGGAALGAGLGAMIGASTGNYYRGPCGGYYYSGGNAGQGAAIGAGIGLVAGALVGLARQQSAAAYEAPAYAYTPDPVPGYGYTSAYTAVPGPVPVSAPPVVVASPNYVVGGTLVGAASGALIGQGLSQKPGAGAAIGAASGLVVGSLAQASVQSRPAAVPVEPQAVLPPVSSTYVPAAVPRHQIADAPRVPDAPAF